MVALGVAFLQGCIQGVYRPHPAAAVPGRLLVTPRQGGSVQYCAVLVPMSFGSRGDQQQPKPSTRLPRWLSSCCPGPGCCSETRPLISDDALSCRLHAPALGSHQGQPGCCHAAGPGWHIRGPAGAGLHGGHARTAGIGQRAPARGALPGEEPWEALRPLEPKREKRSALLLCGLKKIEAKV